jgi:hypothetical protein
MAEDTAVATTVDQTSGFSFANWEGSASPSFSFVQSESNAFQGVVSSAASGTKHSSNKRRSPPAGRKKKEEADEVASVSPAAAPSAPAAKTGFEMDPEAPSLLDKLPVPLLHKILFLLEEPRKVDQQLLDPVVMLADDERKLSRSMASLMLSCKSIYRSGMKRGGVPTSRPVFYAVCMARRGEREQLQELLQTIGARGQTQALLDRALMESCTTASAERVCEAAALLLDAGASARAVCFYGQPVHVAARRGHEGLLRLLLDRGADPTALDGVGFTAMQCASNSGNEPLARLLQEVWDARKQN